MILVSSREQSKVRNLKRYVGKAVELVRRTRTDKFVCEMADGELATCIKFRKAVTESDKSYIWFVLERPDGGFVTSLWIDAKASDIKI